MREIVFDTETTGLRPDEGHRMVEIGCLEMINRVETGQRFHCYFNPQRPMPPEAEQVHGLSDRFLSDKPLFAEKADELLAFLGDAPLIAHNAGFDLRFLNAELAQCGRAAIPADRTIDTAAMARSRFPGSPASLDALCARFGVDRSHRTLHGALLDAELLAQVYIELTGGRQIGLGLVVEEIRETRTVVALHRGPGPDRPVRPARPHAASAAELERHRAFLAKLEKPLWLSRG